MQEKRTLTFEIKKLLADDDDNIVGGEINLSSKEFEINTYDEEKNEWTFGGTAKITNCVKLVGTFKKNDQGKFIIDLNEKGFFKTEEELLKWITENDSIYSVRNIDTFVNQLIVMYKLRKRMNKYQKLGWTNFFLCCSKNVDGEDVLFTFASRKDATRESKKKFYQSMLLEHNLTQGRVFSYVDVEQLNYFNKLTL